MISVLADLRLLVDAGSQLADRAPLLVELSGTDRQGHIL
jgi:hypothetical protein